MSRQSFHVIDGLVLCRHDEVIPDARPVSGGDTVILKCWKCQRTVIVGRASHIGQVLAEHPEIYHLAAVTR